MKLIECFDIGAERFPGRFVIVDENRGWTYREIQKTSHQIASALLEEGLTARSIVATWSPNHAMAFAAQYGIVRAGGIWFPIRGRDNIDRIRHILGTFEIDWLFFHSEVEAVVAQIKSNAPTIKGLVCLDRRSSSGPFLLDWLATHRLIHSFPERSASDVISMMTTSGTTGEPKAVMQMNTNWETMIASYQQFMRFDKPPVHIVVQALTHAAGCFAASMLSTGVTNVLVPPNPVEILEAIQRHSGSVIYLPSTLIYQLLREPRLSTFDLSSLRYFHYGSEPISPTLLRQALSAFGPVMAQSYGQVEALMAITFFSPEDHMLALRDAQLSERLHSAGRANPNMSVAIMDDHGRLLEKRQVGEIVCKGNLVMKGYYRNEPATAVASANGWHHTGDLGFVDEDDFIYIIDRMKDVIKTSGCSVFAIEVEKHISAHPSVQDCAVIGVPDPEFGEAVTAVVVLRPNAIVDEGDLIAWCTNVLHPIQIPKSVRCLDALPRSETGKILKRELRASLTR